MYQVANNFAFEAYTTWLQQYAPITDDMIDVTVETLLFKLLIYVLVNTFFISHFIGI